MKKIGSFFFILLFVCFTIGGNTGHSEELTLQGIWEISERTPRMPAAAGTEPLSVVSFPSRMYFVDSGPLSGFDMEPSFGGALNLKYYAGISYDYLQKNLPGKTISLKVFVPEVMTSKGGALNRIRITLKSEKDGQWGDYFTEDSWIMVKKAGIYDVELKIPEAPVTNKYGSTFYPENTILLSIEYDVLDKRTRKKRVIFSFFDFKISGLDLDPSRLKWQFVKNGYTQGGMYLPGFAPGSAIIRSMGKLADLDFTSSGGKNITLPEELSGNGFLTMKIYIPEELRRQKGALALSVRDTQGLARSSVKRFNSCNLEGDVYITIPLDPFLESGSRELDMSLRIKTRNPHTPDMMPLVLSPVEIKNARLVPFDKKWELRDVQGLGGYKNIEIRRDGLVGSGGITVHELYNDLYQLDGTVRLKGGIDWGNPYYRVELVRELEGAPLDLNDVHLEVIISPLDDYTDIWQKPIRARIGLMDVEGNLMFGPNVSLSEGLPSLAALEVSMTNPIPKGLVTPGFDPGKVKDIVINIEASHGPAPVRDIKFSLVNLAMRPEEYPAPAPPKKIDFSRFKRDPGSWKITGLIRDTGGYVVGINYPFPVLDVSEEVLKVPQIYPCVGMKATDPRHFGFAGELTRKTTTDDFTTFAENNITLVRLLVLGHLDGIYTWDEKGRDISGFGTGIEPAVQEAAGMSVEKFAEFLNRNENMFFVRDDSGKVLGLEEHVLPDMTALLDILEDVEKKTGKRLMAILSLYDFLLGDYARSEGPLRIYTVGEHPEVVTDQLIKTKALALMWKMMKELRRDPRFYKYIAVVEIMNEPGNATALSTRKYFGDLLNFVGEGLYLLKDALGPSMPVTVGFRSWPEDLRYWAPIGGGVDVLMPHYWESLESYNLDRPGMWSLDMPAGELWKFLGQSPDGRLTGMGEISPGGDFNKNLFRLENAGYDFALVWSYSGHDGHDGRGVLTDISDYQKADILFGNLKKLPEEYIANAFIYVKTARFLFSLEKERSGKGKVREEDTARFIPYLKAKTRNMRDSKLKEAVNDIIKIMDLKGLPLDQTYIKTLFELAVKKK